MKILISQRTGRYYYYKGEGEYHCKEGYFTEEDLHSGATQIYTKNSGIPFYCLPATLSDRMKKLRRGPQILTSKDLGYIIVKCGLDRQSRIVEAGGGSGGATVVFARFVDALTVYECRDEHREVLERNIDYMGVAERVEVKAQDIIEGIGDEQKADLLFLDLPDPQVVLQQDTSLLPPGAYVVCYLPSINQVHTLCQYVEHDARYYCEEVTEVGLRHWKVKERVVRPETRKEMDHTAFLVFLRKVTHDEKR